MGQGYRLECNCGCSLEAWTGIGYLYPQVLAETIQEAREGKLGPELKEFVEQHPEGVINAEKVLLRCRKCGSYQVEKDLSAYLPGKGKALDKYAPERSGRLYLHYPHKCLSCGSEGEMEVVPDKELKEGIVCPVCGKRMKQTGIIDWD